MCVCMCVCVFVCVNVCVHVCVCVLWAHLRVQGTLDDDDPLWRSLRSGRLTI